MHAAVVRSFDQPPRYETFATPEPTEPHEVGVDVLAAALHPRVRSTADGSHYESTGELPLIPGIDGVGRTDDGTLVYFVLPDTLLGSMAQRVVIDRRRSAVLPDGVDPVAIAAGMNPAMSSWIALRKRIAFAAGQNVLVLGATGSAGSMAVPIARHLGAGRIVAAGRNAVALEALRALGADETVRLDGDPDAVDAALGAAADAARVDVVIDYLWGTVAQRAIPAILHRRSDRGRPLTWIQIGSMAGRELTLPSEWLRAAALTVVGSGQGAVPTREIVAELPGLAAHITAQTAGIDAIPTPLSDVASAWAAGSGRAGRAGGARGRIVFIP
jgi:NADPH:quinone reductase-like Zn-dependent oxidoreductase